MVQKTEFFFTGRNPGLLLTSPERINNLEKFQLAVEIETGIKYMKTGGDGKIIANEILGEMWCEMEV